MATNGKVGTWSPERWRASWDGSSIGLGVAQILAPRKVGRLIGVNPRHDFRCAFWVCANTSGLGILTHAGVRWVWSRWGATPWISRYRAVRFRPATF